MKDELELVSDNCKLCFQKLSDSQYYLKFKIPINNKTYICSYYGQRTIFRNTLCLDCLINKLGFPMEKVFFIILLEEFRKSRSIDNSIFTYDCNTPKEILNQIQKEWSETVIIELANLMEMHNIPIIDYDVPLFTFDFKSHRFECFLHRTIKKINGVFKFIKYNPIQVKYNRVRAVPEYGINI
jgi:hypothetical protein